MAKEFKMHYKTYDTSKGYGSKRKWQELFNERMSGGEARAIIAEQQDTPCSILELPESASQAEIKAAFRRLILIWHPDKNAHNAENADRISKKIIAAYTILTH